MFTTICTNCNANIEYDHPEIGRGFKCPCGTIVTLPMPRMPRSSLRLVVLASTVCVLLGLGAGFSIGWIGASKTLANRQPERVEVPVIQRVEIPVEKRVEVPVVQRVEVPVERRVEVPVIQRVEVPAQPPRPTIGSPLRGIKEVRVAVIVSASDPALEHEVFGNMMKDLIRQDAELKLRKAGLVVNGVEGTGPELVISFAVVHGGKDIPAVAADWNISLIGSAVVQNNTLATITIWQNSGVAYLGSLKYDLLRSDASDGVDGFLNEWLAANPLRPGTP